MGDERHDQEGIGFSGISSLLPDDPPDPEGQSSALPIQDANPGSTPQRPATSEPKPATPTPLFPGSPSSPARKGNSAIWVWIGIGVLILVIWASNQSGTQPPQQSSDQFQAAPTESDSQSQVSASGNQEATTGTAAPQFSAPILQPPPVGAGNVLSVAEITYCLALKQRVEAGKQVVDDSRQDQIDRFNSMVDDYNSRCHEFLYHTGDLEQAQRDAAPFTKYFGDQGRRMVRYGKLDEAGASHDDAEAALRQKIRDAQRALNVLGYHAGTPDGLMGGRTEAAIELFQRQAGLPVDGMVTDSLTKRLQVAEASPRQPKLSPPSSVLGATVADGGFETTTTPDMAAGFVHARAIGDCSPKYPVGESRVTHEGTVTLFVRVGTDGGVTVVHVLSSSGSASLDSAAVDAMVQCHFVPARQDGRIVLDEVRIPVSYALNGSQ